ncbi:MAG: hypothetical protein GXP33_07915 [Spirochaetes bacterium]|nr:hypothetical protein [Spirochaetota bacterium]
MKKFQLFPEPQKIAVTGGVYTIKGRPSFVCGSCGKEDYSILQDWCTENSYTLNRESAVISLNLQHDSSEKTTYIKETSSVTTEKYTLDIIVENSRPGIFITYSSRRGILYALATLKQIVDSGGLFQCRIEDYPKFNIRGIIEGYYGPPWNSREREEMLCLLSEYKMNTFFYGPKDDPYHRRLWQTPYDSQSLSRIEKLLNLAEKLGIDFYYSIGPGLSIKYSDERAFNLLCNKLKQLYSIGITKFGFFLDDIPKVLQHTEDKLVYEDLAAAHISIISRLFNYLKNLDPEIKLVVCPTQYHGRGNEYYISKLGQNTNPLIDIFWTGPEICSKELNLYDAAVFTSSTCHKPLYWDNYPVNDLEMGNEMHIGPYINRDIHLYRFSSGIIANGMEYPEASKIPFITIACYLWNPEQYNPEVCWKHSIRRVAGEKDSRNFLVFADNVRYSAIYPSDSPYLVQILSSFIFECLYGDREKGFAGFGKEIARYSDAGEYLLKGIQNKKLFKELKPWFRKYSDGIKLLTSAVDYLKNCDTKEVDSLKKLYKNYQADKIKVFADVLYPFILAVIEGEFSTDKRKAVR